MPSEDYAILVGISYYADPVFPALNGPLADVQLMADWLLSSTGGNLDPTHITTIQSTVPPPNVLAAQMPPLPEQFLQEFRRLVLDPSGHLIRRPTSRLYLYFSGHGFSQIRDQMPRASLYTANANQIVPASIAGTFYALWMKDAAVFRDIVIIMDCCRDAESAKMESIPPLTQIQLVGAAAAIPVFGIYAAPKGGKAQERPIPSRGNQVHGLLTHAVVEAFERAPSDPNGVVTSDDVSNHIRSRWASICGDTPADPPEFALPGIQPLALLTRRDLLSQRIVVSNWQPSEQIDLADGALQPLASIVRSIDGATATVNWAARPLETVPIVNGVVAIKLGGGLYRLKRGTRKQPFEAGGDDVNI
jgi:hypothetical protein